MDNLVYAIRGSFGLCVKRGISPQQNETIVDNHLDPKHAICRSLKFSNNGEYLAYCDSERTVVIETSTGMEIFAADLGKTQHIIFSPRDSVMVTYEPYVIYGSRLNADGSMKSPNPNLRYWSVPERKLLSTTVADKQSTWRPQFTDDETIALRVQGADVLFYENCQFERYVKKVPIKGLDSLVISPGPNPHVLCFIPPQKGQPATIQCRKLAMDCDLPVVSSKVSFNCDKCTMVWNCKGTVALATAMVDVDKSDKSYYGVSHLYMLTTKGESLQVHLDKTGPLHDVKWSPCGKQFAVCYGFMPSKVSVFNLKGDAVWNHGEGHRNEIHYNSFGNILAICSFGNISSGRMEFWNVETRSMINTFDVPSTTYFDWAPDGQHFVTATTAPRLRIENGFRIWNYNAFLRQDVSYDKGCEKKEELWQVCWKPSPNGYAKTGIVPMSQAQRAAIANNVNMKSSVGKHPIDGLVGSAITKKGVYVPPSQRKGADFGKPAQQQRQVVFKPPVSEEEKKVKNLEKKLEDISKLKDKLASGAQLEANQMQKIASELLVSQELALLKGMQIASTNDSFA